MSTNTEQGTYTILMIILYFGAIFFLSGAYGFAIAPFKATFWKIREKSAVKVTGKVIEAKVAESAIALSNPSNRANSTYMASRYYPLITVEFDYNSSKHQTPIILNNLGYRSPEDAFKKVMSIAPGQKIRFYQTYREAIDDEFEGYFKNIRLQVNNNKENYFSFYVNPKNLSENEYEYNHFKWLDWLGSALSFLFGMIIISVPLFLFKVVPLNTRIISVVITFIVSIILYMSWSMVILPWMHKTFNIQRTGRDAPPIFEILIDNNYNGSQIQQYLKKPDTDGN
jgi:hypothetical protein